VAIETAIAWVSLVLASGLLIATGASKILSPAASEPLLAVLRIPAAFRSGRALGVIEICLGSAALITADQRLIAAEAVAFTIFAAVLAYVLAARVPLSSCGCAGARDTPPSLLHVGLNLAAAGATTFAAIESPPTLIEMWPKLDLLGVPLVIGVATAIALWLVAMGPLAELTIVLAHA